MFLIADSMQVQVATRFTGLTRLSTGVRFQQNLTVPQEIQILDTMPELFQEIWMLQVWDVSGFTNLKNLQPLQP